VTEPLRVLILEDNPSDAELIQFELQEAGIVFTAKVVMTEESFVRELQAFSPDLILSDYDLPKYTGALALAEAKRRCPDTPFILVTGAVTEDRAIDILTQGAKDYVLKNRLQQRLAPAVRRALAEAEEHRARKQAEAELREAHRTLESLVESRTVELQAILDTAPVAIWIAHDPECKSITGNTYADEMIMKTSRLGNISRSTDPGEAAVFYKVFHNGMELKPEEMPAQVCTATGKPVSDMEVELVFSDGRKVHLLESAVPLFDSDGRVRGAVITGSDISKIRQSESALKDSEERIQQALCVSHSFTFEWELATDRVRRSESCATILRLTGDEAVNDTGQNYFQRVHSDDRARFVAMLDSLTPANASYTAEYRVVRDDGHVVVFDETGAATFDAAGKLARLAGVTTDITVRKRAEDALRASEERLRLAQQAAHLGAWDWHVGTGRTSWTPELEQIYGYEPGTAPGNYAGFRDRVHPDDLAEVERLREEAVQAHQPFDFDFRIRLAAGQIRWLSCKGAAVYDEVGQPQRVFGVNVDITARKQAEEALAAAHRQTQRLIDNTMALIFACDLEERFVIANAALAALLKTTPEQLIGKRRHEFMPQADADAHEANDQKVIATGQAVEVEEHSDLHGRSITWLSTKFPLRDAQGRIYGVAGIVTDITGRKQMEDALRVSEERFRLAAAAAHAMVYDMDVASLRVVSLDGLRELLGYEPSEAELTLDWWDRRIHPDDLAMCHAAFQRMRSDGQGRTLHYRLRHKDSRIIDVEDNATAVRDTAGNIVRIVGTVVDITARKQAEEALRESEDRLRRIAQAGRIGIFEWNATTDAAYWSREHYELFGMAPGTPISWERWRQGVHPDDRERVEQNAARMLEQGRAQGQIRNHTDEYRYRRPDGTEVWLESNISLDMVGNEAMVRGSVRDVTDRKRAEESMRKQQWQLRLAMQAGKLVPWEIDLVGEKVEPTPQLLELFGLGPDAPLGSRADWRALIHEEDRPKIFQSVEAAKTGQELHLEYRIRHPDGTIHWHETHGIPLADATGCYVRLVGYVCDVTDRRQVEDAFRASEARFRLTLKNSPVLVTMQDTNLVYQWVFNTRTRRPEEVVGKTDADLFAPDEAAALSAAKSQVLETGTEVREAFWLTSNGQRVFLDCYFEPVRDAAGKIIGVGGASVNLTEQKHAEEALTDRTRQLDDANEELESFTYSVSHDLRAPLRAIDGFARMILKQQGDKFDEKTRNQFDVIMKNTKMMGQLIQDLLALSRLGREAISMSKLNIGDLARDVWEELNANNPDRPIDLKIDHVPPATGDRSFIKQVLVNLLANAIKFTRIREVPLIEVGGYEGEAESVYYVRDNGVGFDMQYLGKLFGVFQRLHSANEYEGTGIGLALVQRIIHRHGGRVWAEGEVDKGATFYFSLPCAQKETAC
jgi:PAS domain S-box-containing protein